MFKNRDPLNTKRPVSFLISLLLFLGTIIQLLILGSRHSSMSEQVHCMVMRINLDCNACCRKMRRIILRMKEIETHMIEKQQHRVTVCGRFVPAEVAIKIRKKMNRRVKILEIQELGNINGHVEQIPPPVLAQPVEQMPPVLAQPV